MNAPVLTGVYGAWAVAQLAMGILFLSAYVARRRDEEYLLFSLLCFALTVVDAGIGATYATRSVQAWVRIASLTNAAVATSTAVGLHFALSFVDASGNRRSVLAVVYALAAVYVTLAVTDQWIDPASLSVRPTRYLGFEVMQVLASARPLASTFYVLLGPAYLWVIWLLWTATRAGRREARGVLIAVILGSVLLVNDILVATYQIPTTYLTPFSFLMYGFGFASALLDRYERAASDLEVTASELRNATDELASSYVELSNVQGELFRRRQLASVGELAGTIAHEVRNPLAVIRNAAASLRRRAAREEDRETLLAIVDEEIDRLNGLVTELLRFARPVNVERGEVSLDDVVSSLSKDMPESFRIELEIVEPRAEVVWGDPTLVRLALDNLVANAVQAMPKGGTVTVRASFLTIEGVTVSRVDVVDQGAGMDDVTRARAFDPFYTTRPKGTGLGLPIVRRIMEAHDGTATMDSRRGEGTTVSLLFPMRVDALGRTSSVPATASIPS